MILEADNANDLYDLAISAVREGEPVSPRGLATHEIRGVVLKLTGPNRNLVTRRRLNIRFMAAEFIWILTGQNRTELISKFNTELLRFSDDGYHLRGAYGPPLTDQLPWIIQCLAADHDTRQAVLTIWRPAPHGSLDVPCTVAMHFMLRASGLEMAVFMRSNDVWLGLPYDLFTFTMIQRYVADALRVEAGTYHHHVSSLHLYDRDFRRLETTLIGGTETIDTTDLSPSYPWPMGALACLVAAPTRPSPYPLFDQGWFNLTALLMPAVSSESEKWRRLLQRYGMEPRGFRELVCHPSKAAVHPAIGEG